MTEFLRQAREMIPGEVASRQRRLAEVIRENPGSTITIERLSDWCGRWYKTGLHYKLGSTHFPSRDPHQLWAHVGCVRGHRGWVAA